MRNSVFFRLLGASVYLFCGVSWTVAKPSVGVVKGGTNVVKQGNLGVVKGGTSVVKYGLGGKRDLRVLLSSNMLMQFVLSTTQKAVKKGQLHCRQAEQYALKHNPALRVKRQKLLVALRRFESSRFFPSNPELTANGKAKLKDDPIKSSFYKLETKLSWKIPIGGWWLQRQAWLKKALARARQEWEAAQIKLSLDVRGACYEVMVQRAKANLFREMFAFFTRIHKLIEIRKQTGAANVLDLNLAYTEKLQSQASFQVAGALWVAKRRALRILMGWPQNGAKLPRIYGEVGPIVHKKLNLPSLIKRALQRHYLLGIIRKRILESKAKLAFADAKAFPDFKFGFFYTLQEDPDLQHVLGGGLTIPLPLFQRNQEKRWTQREKVLKFQLQRKALRFRIQQKVLQTYRLLRVYQKTYQLYEQRFLPTLKTQLSLNMRGLRLGRFSVLKVISAQQSQNKARMKSIETLEKAMKSYLTLQKAMGQLLD